MINDRTASGDMTDQTYDASTAAGGIGFFEKWLSACALEALNMAMQKAC